MWDLSGPGLKPVSPALAGGFLTTAPPGKPLSFFLMGASSNTVKGWSMQFNKISFMELSHLERGHLGISLNCSDTLSDTVTCPDGGFTRVLCCCGFVIAAAAAAVFDRCCRGCCVVRALLKPLHVISFNPDSN